MFTAALSILPKRGNNLNVYPWSDEALGRKRIFVGTWMMVQKKHWSRMQKRMDRSVPTYWQTWMEAWTSDLVVKPMERQHPALGRIDECQNYNQFSSVAQSCPTLCDSMNCSTPGLPVHHQLLETAQNHVHWVSDAIQPSHLLSSPSPPSLNLSQHQGLFKWVSSSHQVAKVLEFQLQHQSFQWTPRTDLL